MNEQPHDCLRVTERAVSHQRVILFHGKSGSGKSTAIRHLISQSSCFRGRDVTFLHGPPFRSTHATRSDVLVIDELLTLHDLARVFGSIRRSKQAVIATHVAPQIVRALLPWRAAFLFRTDRCPVEISRALTERGIAHTSESVRRFVDRFGASYTDLEIVLERCPDASFDRSLSRFTRFCHIELDHRPRLMDQELAVVDLQKYGSQ